MVKSAMPSTFQSAVVLEGSLTDEMVRNGSLANPSVRNKREWTSNFAKRVDEGSNKRNVWNAIKSYTGVAKEERNPDQGTLHLCYKCGLHHLGEFYREIVCFRCKRKGHTVRDCKEPGASKPVCYNCGAEDHMRNVCPKLKGGSQLGARKHEEEHLL